MVNYVRRASDKKGLPAGTALYIGDTEPLTTEVTYVNFSAESQLIQTQLSLNNIVTQIKEMSKEQGWLHIAGLKDAQAIHDICQRLEIHALVIEDILDTEQLAKIEIFSHYALIIVKDPCITDILKPIKFEQFSFIIMDRLLITFQESHKPITTYIENYCRHANFTAKDFNPGYLTYLLMDMMIDDHFSIVEKKGDALELLEEEVIGQHTTIKPATLYLLKRDMLHMCKNIMALRNIVSTLLREHTNFLSQLPEIYLKDIQDHLSIILESIDIHRELSTNILDIYMSTTNNKINDTMKFLTIFTSIFIPLSFVASLYGMNFAYIPELDWQYGYYATLGFMVAIASGLLFYFRRRKWL